MQGAEKALAVHNRLLAFYGYPEWRSPLPGLDELVSTILSQNLEEVAARYRADFPAVEVLTVEQVAGDWATAHALHFADGGLFDRLSHR